MNKLKFKTNPNENKMQEILVVDLDNKTINDMILYNPNVSLLSDGILVSKNDIMEIYNKFIDAHFKDTRGLS